MTRAATPRKPQARSQARIDSILDAARTLLAEQGVASLSIYSVAERAGIPPSSVYHFFASVPALLEALTADIHAAFRASLQAPSITTSSPPGATCHASSSCACWPSTTPTPPPAN